MTGQTSRRRERRLGVGQLLRDHDLKGLHALARDDPNLLSGVVAQLNERDALLCWRAVEALGLLCANLARENLTAVRNQVRRQLWAMTEESGNQAWHAPEAIGEILYHVEDLAPEFAPVLSQHQEEPIFRPGTLWAIGRLASRYPRLVREDADIVLHHLTDEEPRVRGYAAWALGQLRHAPAVGGLQVATADEAALDRYDFDSGELVHTTVGALAGQALGLLQAG